MNSNDAEEWRNEWIPVTQAAREVKTYAGKISKLIKQGKLQSQADPLDERVVLVQRQAVYQMFRKSLT